MTDRVLVVEDNRALAENVAEMTVLAAEEVRRFGIQPKVALLSASNFGSVDLPSSRKMREALAILKEIAPDLEVEGEMHGDAALSAEIRMRVFPNSRLKGEANLLIMPTLDAANIAFNLLKTTAAVRLLGAEVILTGITAQVARTMVQLGVDVSSMHTVSRLSDGIELALSMVGKTITTKGA